MKQTYSQYNQNKTTNVLNERLNDFKQVYVPDLSPIETLPIESLQEWKVHGP